VTEKKYSKNVYAMKYIQGRGGANAKQMTFNGGEQLNGMELNFIVGVYDQTGDWAPDMGAHDHPFDECLIFFGYDEKDMGYLGSDMSLAMGKEYEVHKFNIPTVAAAPANMPHCPLITEKVYKPFGHFHLALSGKYAGTGIKQEGTTDGKKYNYLFNKMPVKIGPEGADAVQTITMEGKALAGMPVNFKMGLHNHTGEWYPGKGSCMHPYDTALIFFGHKTDDLTYLGAEISVEVGKEHEKHTFNVPTVISLPAGTPYAPITCNKLEKPYRVMQVGLNAKYNRTWIT
jgi:hypothetical protein